ncbi:hypothetical protein H0H93_013015 [Arthromyces matolae]|nr:hypothetical protein H0H93_013015 [Arthromyces matolae]
MTTTTATLKASVTTALRPSEENTQGQASYRYANLLPYFSQDHYPPLTFFEHADPGHRALNHTNPRSFLDNAVVVELTPKLGSEVHGVNLAVLSNDARDELALEAGAFCTLLIFKSHGEEFLCSEISMNSSTEAPNFTKLGAFCKSVTRDENTTYNFEVDESITTTLWHSDVSYELQPPGLTTFFLLSQPTTGGDTLFTSQISALKKLSPQFVAFLRTLKAVHSGVEQADFSRSGKRGGIVRREPVENVHPVVRKHPVTGEEALYVNRQFTRRIVDLKREESAREKYQETVSETLLKFLYDHIDKSADNQVRVKWQPGTVVLWDNRITAHSAIVDYKESTERRHGARITPQAERPIGALELDLN